MADLKNPEQVKTIVTTQTTWSKLTRRRHAETYDAFLRFMKRQKPLICTATKAELGMQEWV